MKRKGKLSNKLALMVAIAIVIAIISTTVVLTLTARNNLYETMKSLGLSMSKQAISRIEGKAITDNDIQEVISDLGRDLDVVYALLVDDSYQALYHSNPERVGMSFQDPGTESAMKGNTFTDIYYSSDRGINVYDIILPFYGADGRVVGAFNIGLSVETVDKTVSGMILSASVVGLLMAFMMSMLSYGVIRFVLSPLQKMTHTAEAIATGDLTETITYSGNNEIGAMASAFAKMIEKLRGNISAISQNAESVNQASGALSDTSKEVSISMEEVTASTEEMSAALEEVSSFSEEIATSTEEMAQSMHELMAKINEGKAFAKTIEEQAQGLNAQSSKAKQHAEHTYHTMDIQIQKAIEDSKIVKDISAMADGISSISEQINLLALNAAIEAARAGEQGRGFAVVAEEVRKLAGESAETVKGIMTLTSSVQATTDRLVNSSKEIMTFVSTEVLSDYNLLISTADRYREDAIAVYNMNDHYAQLAHQMLMTVQEVNRQVESIAQNIEQITSGSQDIAGTTGVVSEAISHLSKSTQDMKAIAVMLHDIVKQYHI